MDRTDRRAVEVTLSALSSDTLFVAAGPESEKTPFPGINVRPLFQPKKGGSQAGVLAFQAGAVFPDHGHPGGEYVLMLEGQLRIGDRCLNPGDFLYTAPGERHEAEALTYCRFFILVPKPITFELDPA
jgi:quercetin dioxygenase-like cupin family protein